MHSAKSPDGKLRLHYDSDFSGEAIFVDDHGNEVEVDARAFVELAKQVVENDRLMNGDVDEESVEYQRTIKAQKLESLGSQASRMARELSDVLEDLVGVAQDPLPPTQPVHEVGKTIDEVRDILRQHGVGFHRVDVYQEKFWTVVLENDPHAENLTGACNDLGTGTSHTIQVDSENQLALEFEMPQRSWESTR